MTDALPRVSVIVLTHNRLAMLRDAVQTLLDQDYPADRLDVIVVNDGSTDGTRGWLDDRAGDRVRAVHQDARGIPAARNAGLRAAHGEIVAIVADDYLLAPDYVSTFVGFFAQHPEAQVVRFGMVPADRWPGSLLSHFYYDVSFRKRLQPEDRPRDLRRGVRIRALFRRLPPEPETITADHRLEAAGAAAFRREVFARIGGFDERLKRAEDTDMSIRMRAGGIRIYYHPFHKIRHRYGHWGGDTLIKCYESGLYAARLRAKLKAAGSPDRGNAAGSGGYRLLSLIWRMRQAANPLLGVLLFPGVLVFEGAWQYGFLQESLRRRLRRRVTPGGNASRP